MNVAVIGNIDGQAEVLTQALAQIEEEGILTILHTGNAALGPEGHHAISLLRSANVVCVQGETDRNLSKLERKRARLERELGDAFDAHVHALEGLRAADVEWLGTLRESRNIECDGAPVLLCHGMPDDHRAYFDKDTVDQRLQRARESASAQAVVSGGARAFFKADIGRVLLMNAPALLDEGRGQWVRLWVEPGTARAEVVRFTPTGL